MASTRSTDNLRITISRFSERLWVKPLLMCLLSVAAVFAAKLSDNSLVSGWLPTVDIDSVETLLDVMASSMLVIATFAVASMVSAYASASSAATPRSFPLVLADDVSQNALSTFIGAFIFSIVALTAVTNGYFGEAGLLTLFATTILVFAIVIAMFVRWVDRIARLGRLGPIIDKVEDATQAAIDRRRQAPNLGGVPVRPDTAWGRAVPAPKIGYVQHVDIDALQAWAERAGGRVIVDALPGSFAVPGRPLARINGSSHRGRSGGGGGGGGGGGQTADSKAGADADADIDDVARCFDIGRARRFDDDPRFGLVVLAEIADRALSPAVNDPGTAIQIIGAVVRLLARWAEPVPASSDGPSATKVCDRVEVPALATSDLFDDAFRPIARDGAGAVEVAVRLQKGLAALHHVGDEAMRAAALRHMQQALARSRAAMVLAEDFAEVAQAAGPAVAASLADRPQT